MPARRPERRSAAENLLIAALPLMVGMIGACTGEPSQPTAASPAAPVVVRSKAPPSPTADATAVVARVEVEPLPVPGSLRVTSQSSTEVALAWQPSSHAGGPLAYEVLRGDDARVLRTAETSTVDGNLKPGTRYCYAVRAVDSAGRNSAPCASVCTRTLDTSPPTSPAGVTASARPGNAVELSWTPSTDDVGVKTYEVFRAEALVASSGGTSAREEHLTPGKEYCWKVTALDAAGNRSTPSDPACLTVPDTTPPSVPTQVTASAAGERTVDVVWEASRDDVGVVRYEIQRADAPLLVAASTSARERGLAPARRYCFAVRACDAAGNCSAPAPEACATTPDLTPPTSPATFAAEARNDVAIQLDWAPASDEVGVVGYEVKRGDRVLAASHSEVAFKEEGLRPGTRYCYSVLALDAAGNRSEPKGACASTLDLTPPTRPGRPAAVSVSSSQLFLAWEPSTDDVGVTGYEVLRAGVVVASVTATRMRERNLPANMEGCYTVRAFDASGNRSESAGPACARTADPTQVPSPSDLQAVRASSTSVLLRWEPSEQKGVLYRIYANGTKSVGLTRWNTFTPSGRMGARADCYRVAAVDDQLRESPHSNEVCASPVAGAITQR
jgi:chitodextrinase